MELRQGSLLLGLWQRFRVRSLGFDSSRLGYGSEKYTTDVWHVVMGERS